MNIHKFQTHHHAHHPYNPSHYFVFNRRVVFSSARVGDKTTTPTQDTTTPTQNTTTPTQDTATPTQNTTTLTQNTHSREKTTTPTQDTTTPTQNTTTPTQNTTTPTQNTTTPTQNTYSRRNTTTPTQERRQQHLLKREDNNTYSRLSADLSHSKALLVTGMTQIVIVQSVP